MARVVSVPALCYFVKLLCSPFYSDFLKCLLLELKDLIIILGSFKMSSVYTIFTQTS